MDVSVAPNDCFPPKIGPGNAKLDLFPAWFVATDFAFAVLPWFVVWDLNMKQKEKITVACGLSLGVL